MNSIPERGCSPVALPLPLGAGPAAAARLSQLMLKNTISIFQRRAWAGAHRPRKLPRSVSRSVAGFTLIELLVVIAIIAIIASILLPVLAAAQKKALSTQCLANEKQLIGAWIMYAGDSNDYLVPNRGLNGAGGTPGVNYSGNPLLEPQLQPGGANADWCPGDLQPLNGGSTQPDITPGSKYPGGSIYSLWIEAGLLYPYINNISVYKCPGDHSIVPRGGGAFTAPALRTYSMNCWVQPMDAPGNNTATWNGITGWAYYTKQSNMRNPGPAQTWVFVEESPYSIDDAFFAVNPNTPTEWYNSPAVLHGHSSVLSYGDGHSALRRWTDGSMISEQPTTPSGNTDNWPIQPNTGDLAWFISVTTAPTK